MLEEDKYLAYIRWQCTPAKERFPKQLNEYISLTGTTQEEISSFMSSPTYYQDLEREAKNWGKGKLPQIIEKAYEAALLGKPQAITAFAALLEDKKNSVNINFGLNITDEQYERILKREARLRHASREAGVIELLPSD